jgi:hypothetical protein
MKRIFGIMVPALLVGGSVLAGPDVIIRERAKELRDQNNVRQGVASPGQAAAPAARTPTATPTVSPALVKLQSDLAAVKVGSPVPAVQKQQIAQDLLAVALGAKPSPITAAKLAEGMANACAERQLTAANRARLVQEIDAVLNPAKYPQAKMDGIYADVQAIFQERQDSPMTSQSRKQAVEIVTGLKAMAGEIQRGGVK